MLPLVEILDQQIQIKDYKDLQVIRDLKVFKDREVQLVLHLKGREEHKDQQVQQLKKVRVVRPQIKVIKVSKVSKDRKVQMDREELLEIV